MMNDIPGILLYDKAYIYLVFVYFNYCSSLRAEYYFGVYFFVE